MARVVKEDVHAAKRNEILDVARRLIYTKGYEQMTIQDILDELHMSKGAFYHYYDSKGAVLEAVIERMAVDEVIPMLVPIAQDPQLSAVEKLNHYFDTATRWKTAKRTFMMELLRVWMADENAIVRQKLYSMSIKHVTPLLTEIVQQGVREGALMTPYPDQMGKVIYTIAQGLGDIFGELLLSDEPGRDNLQELETVIAAYTDTIERVLGAPGGSLKLMDTEMLKEWLEPVESEEVV
jgi:AcrR family transcriptional regulator